MQSFVNVKKIMYEHTETTKLVTPDSAIMESTETSGIQVPVLKLLNVSSSYDQWTKFSDTFDSLIHKNSTSAYIKKLISLKLCVKSDTAEFSQSIECSEHSYDIAWNLPKDRFDNKKSYTNTFSRSLSCRRCMKNNFQI